MEIYEKKLVELSKRLSEKWASLLQCMETDLTDEEVNHTEILFTSTLKQYEAEYSHIFTFLEKTRSEQSFKELDSLKLLHEKNMKPITLFRDKLTRRKQTLDSTSVFKHKGSASVTLSDPIIVQKYVAAETAQAKLKFVEKEAELLKRQAELKEKQLIAQAENERKKSEVETELLVLSTRKAAATALAEAEALDNLFDDASVVSSKLSHVNRHKKEVHTDDISPVPQSSNVSVAGEIMKYLLRKELLLTRLVNFDDSSDYYQSWKCSFRQVCDELNLSAIEEMDLLIKWLGPNSRKHAQSLKNVYRHDPSTGLLSLWQRLDERFGSTETVYQSVVNKLERIPKLTYTDSSRWYELLDTLSEILALKSNSEYSIALSYFDSSVGTSSILMKLPPGIQEKWAFRVNTYRRVHKVTFPPFKELVSFVNEQATVRNDPSLLVNNDLWKRPKQQSGNPNKKVTVNKADVAFDTLPEALEFSNKADPYDVGKWCPLHKKKHSLNECRVFKMKSFQERKQFLKNNRVCFKCCDSDRHRAAECKATVKCNECGGSHPTAMHINRTQNSGENREFQETVHNSCLQICGQNQSNGKSCAKIFLVKIHCSVNPSNIVKCYAIVDEQSNRSLIKPKLFSLLNIDGEEYQYTLNSCAGVQTVKGRRASNCVLESLDGSVGYPLPSLIECHNIPDNRDEICSPKDVSHHSHLSHLASIIPNIEEKAEILMIIGRDVAEAHHVKSQITGPPEGPFAQKLGLGWAIIGEVCLGKIHMQKRVNVNKTNILSNGRPSLFKPCDSKLITRDMLYDPVFVKDVNDDKLAHSVDDREFLSQMDLGFKKSQNSNRWTAPLPFKPERQRLPNNRVEALRRARSLSKNLNRYPIKRSHMVEFMQKILDNGHAEVAPDVGQNEEC